MAQPKNAKKPGRSVLDKRKDKEARRSRKAKLRRDQELAAPAAA